MNDDERLDGMIQDLAKDYHRPPETPRAEMWAQIGAERASVHRQPAIGARRIRWMSWAIGLAATLVVGVAIGRLTVRSPGAPPVALAPDAAGNVTEQVPAAYREAAAEHLSHVETFLSVFGDEVSAGVPSPSSLEPTARQLLRRTRMLRGSPVAEDVAVRALLDDVEFVLLQIASYAQGGGTRELGFVERGINERSVLLRLRSALPSAPARAAAGGAL
jgi:hypothetical protein